MIIENAKLRSWFSSQPCEFCPAPAPSHCAHIFAKGMGGNPIDIRENLVSLCWRCHRNSHDGFEPTFEQLLTIAARREGTTPQAIRQLVWAIKRADKNATLQSVRDEQANSGNLANSEQWEGLTDDIRPDTKHRGRPTNSQPGMDFDQKGWVQL